MSWWSFWKRKSKSKDKLSEKGNLTDLGYRAHGLPTDELVKDQCSLANEMRELADQAAINNIDKLFETYYLAEIRNFAEKGKYCCLFPYPSDHLYDKLVPIFENHGFTVGGRVGGTFPVEWK